MQGSALDPSQRSRNCVDLGERDGADPSTDSAGHKLDFTHFPRKDTVFMAREGS